jgi:hypothetical protein
MMLAVDLATARVRMSRPPLAFTTIVGEMAAVDGAQWDVLAERRGHTPASADGKKSPPQAAAEPARRRTGFLI